MNNLWALVIKEVKELVRDPKILIGVILMPVLIFPVMGSAIQISQESVQRAVRGASFAVFTDDEGFVTEALLEYLYTNNTVVPIEAGTLQEALTFFTSIDSNSMVYIPKGYNENITLGKQGGVKIYANLKSLNMAETQSTDLVSNLINIYNYYFSITKIQTLLTQQGAIGTATGYRSPITIDYASILKGSVLEIPPSAIFSLVMSQSIMLPIMVMMMVMFAIQMAATSIALEKEQKTLETLMTLPVNRMFENKLALLHLRKPVYDREKLSVYLNKINREYHPRIVIHSCYDLLNDYNLGGIHIKVSDKELKGSILDRFTGRDDINISISYHSLEELEDDTGGIDYAFLSPVFDSISKSDYKAGFDHNELADILENIDLDVIALGGCKADNLQQVKKLGFAGAAFLGSIWNTSDPVASFLEISRVGRQLSLNI